VPPLQGTRAHRSKLQQACKIFKLSSSVNAQANLSERLSSIVRVTQSNAYDIDVNSVSTSANESNAVSIESQRSSSTTIAEDAYHIASVRTSGRLIKLVGLVDSHRAVIMVDSGSTGDFISEKYASEHKLSVRQNQPAKTV
jgi:hypothetical protein